MIVIDQHKSVLYKLFTGHHILELFCAGIVHPVVKSHLLLSLLPGILQSRYIDKEKEWHNAIPDGVWLWNSHRSSDSHNIVSIIIMITKQDHPQLHRSRIFNLAHAHSVKLRVAQRWGYACVLQYTPVTIKSSYTLTHCVQCRQWCSAVARDRPQPEPHRPGRHSSVLHQHHHTAVAR